MEGPILGCHALRSLARALRRWPEAKGRGVDRVLRERVILHVSRFNQCDVCTRVHEGVACRIGLDDAPVDARTPVALRYAELRTLDRERDHPDEVARFEAAFDPAERAALRATIDLFTFNNRFNNTWTRWLAAR